MSTISEKIAEYERRIAVMEVPACNTIQWITRYCDTGRWEDLPTECREDFDWDTFDYRIKPKPREWWLLQFDDGTACATNSRDDAIRRASFSGNPEIIHVVEVLP